MMTLDAITTMMERNNAPCWQVKVFQGTNREPSNVGSFFPSDQEIAKDEKIMVKSIDFLHKQLEPFKGDPDAYFQIDFSPRKSSNGSSKFGPFAFRMANPGLGHYPAQYQGQPQQQGMDQGQTMMFYEKLMELERERREIETARVDLKHERRELDRDKAEWATKRKADEETLSGLKEKYEQRKAAMMDALEEKGEAFIMGLLNGKSPKGNSLSGTKAEVETEELSAEDQLIESIALNIQKRVKGETEIKAVGVFVEKYLSILEEKRNGKDAGAAAETEEAK